MTLYVVPMCLFVFIFTPLEGGKHVCKCNSGTFRFPVLVGPLLESFQLLSAHRAPRVMHMSGPSPDLMRTPVGRTQYIDIFLMSK